MNQHCSLSILFFWLQQHRRKNREQELRTTFDQCWNKNNSYNDDNHNNNNKGGNNKEVVIVEQYMDAKKIIAAARRYLDEDWTEAQSNRLLRYTELSLSASVLVAEAEAAKETTDPPPRLTCEQFVHIFDVPQPPV